MRSLQLKSVSKLISSASAKKRRERQSSARQEASSLRCRSCSLSERARARARGVAVSRPYLSETDGSGVLSEAPSADLESVLADDTGVTSANAAAKTMSTNEGANKVSVS